MAHTNREYNKDEEVDPFEAAVAANMARRNVNLGELVQMSLRRIECREGGEGSVAVEETSLDDASTSPATTTSPNPAPSVPSYSSYTPSPPPSIYTYPP